MVNELFAKWALGHSGFDGGDIGNSTKRSIWFCGIEWGGGHPADPEILHRIFLQDVSNPALGYEEEDEIPAWKHNISYRFNWQAMKLLTTVNGEKYSDYKIFAENERPFVMGSKGYYKMNLLPLSFKDTSHQWWRTEFEKATGFESKNAYLEWIRSNRLPVLKSWVSIYAPKLILCTGVTWLNDFHAAFVDEGLSLNQETIDDRQLHWIKNSNGTLVAVTPFMSGRNGLVRNVSIQKFGDRIRTLSD